jgi:hypothetical protein
MNSTLRFALQQFLAKMLTSLSRTKSNTILWNNRAAYGTILYRVPVFVLCRGDLAARLHDDLPRLLGGRGHGGLVIASGLSCHLSTRSQVFKLEQTLALISIDYQTKYCVIRDMFKVEQEVSTLK